MAGSHNIDSTNAKFLKRWMRIVGYPYILNLITSMIEYFKLIIPI